MDVVSSNITEVVISYLLFFAWRTNREDIKAMWTHKSVIYNVVSEHVSSEALTNMKYDGYLVVIKVHWCNPVLAVKIIIIIIIQIQPFVLYSISVSDNTLLAQSRQKKKSLF